MNGGLSLVTGGGGFIGTHLVRQLLEQGERVRVLELPGVPLPSEVEAVRGSICEPDTVRRSLQGVHRLFHLAANPNLWARDKGDFLRVNFEGTRTVLAEAARAELEVVVYTSTESILIGKRPKGGLVDAEARPTLDEMPGPYCRSKFLAEEAAFQAARNGLPVVIVAPTLPMGPGDRSLTPPTRMLLDFLNGRIPAYLECGLNLADVRDIARGHILAATRGRPGERYILGNENVMLSELLRMIEEISGQQMPRRRIPYWLALASGGVSEFLSDYVTRRPPKAPLTGVRLARHLLFFDSDKAVTELGYSPSPLRKTLTDAIQWLVGQGWVTRQLPFPQEPADPTPNGAELQ